jgi:alkaline phosphatase D
MRILPLVFSTFLSVSTPALALAGPAVSHGPMIGAMRQDAGTIWIRTNEVADVSVEYGLTADFTSTITTPALTTSSDQDFTAHFRIENLRPVTQYYYRILIDGVPSTDGPQSFRTPPGAHNQQPVKFVVLSDFQAQNPAPVFASAMSENPEFVAMIGDFTHSDPARNETDDATVLSKMRNMRRNTRGPLSVIGQEFKSAFVTTYPNLQRPVYNVWDDHDYCVNNSDETCPFRSQAVQVFREYFPLAPAVPATRQGVWQYYRIGAIVDVMMLDARSNRDPVSLPDNSVKSMLGAQQKSWLKTRLLSSVTPWKIILSPVPFNPGTKPRDAWGAYNTERQEILDFIAVNNIKNVVVISGDIHSGGAVDFGENSGLPEVSTPGANMGTFADTFYNYPGNWSIGIASGYNNPGYVVVNATYGTLDIEIKGLDRQIKLSAETPMILHLERQ